MVRRLRARGLLVHLGRDAVGREHDDGALGHLVGLLDEDRAALLERLHDVQVVHDLLADVDRRAVVLERVLDGLHRAVDAGAVAARLGEQHPTRALGRGIGAGRLGVVEVIPRMVRTAPGTAG